METDNTPIHPNPDMDWQPRYNAQDPSGFFANGMAMRPPVPGTVAKGFLRENTRLFTGQTESGQFVERAPVPVTQALLERGRERYNIFCSVCHGQAGFGQGVVMTGDYGYTPAPSYHQSTLRDTADGYIYEVITNGVRNMPGYAQQVPVADRWAIVAYIRALQRSQNARRENVPPSVLARIEQTGSANMNAARNPVGPGSSGGGEAAESGATGGSDAPSSEGGNASSGEAEEGSNASSQEGGGSESSGNASASAGAASSEGAPASEEQQPASSDAASADASGSDTSGGDTAETEEGTVAADAGMDTTSEETTVAEGAGADTAAASGQGGGGATSGDSRGFLGSTFSVILLVALPIAVLCGILVIAFRKDRDH